MGRANGQFSGKQKDERLCPECGKTVVRIEWDKSPNIKCPECGYTDDVEECARCGNLMSQYSDSVICLNCWENAKKK